MEVLNQVYLYFMNAIMCQMTFPGMSQKDLASLDSDEQSVIWVQSRCRANAAGLRWSQEGDIQSFVTQVLNDIVSACNLQQIMYTNTEKRLALAAATSVQRPSERTPYITVIRKNIIHRSMSAVFAPTIPGSLDNAKVRGHVRDYLMCLKYYHGVVSPIAILSSYSQWQIFWLPEDNNAALMAAPAPAEVLQSASKHLSEPDQPDIMADYHETQANVSLTCNPSPSLAPSQIAALNGTAVYEFNNPSLVPILCSFILKAAAAHVRKLPFTDMATPRLLLHVSGTSIM